MVGMEEIGIRIRKVSIFSIRSCYRLVCDHPLLVCILCLLFLLNRSFPFLFSLFLYISPVFICTAVLLGTLLSFGQPHIPQIDKDDDKTTHYDVSVSKSAVVVQKDDTFVLERFDGNELTSNELGNKSLDDDDGVPLINGKSRGFEFEKLVDENLDDEEEVSDSEVEREDPRTDNEFVDEEIVDESQYSLLPKSVDDQFESRSGDHFESSSRLSWKKIENNDVENEYSDDDDDDEEEEEEESSDSDSDVAESSSPDASMADILPMLDELHPLLDLGAPQPRDVSDAGSERSHESEEKSDEDIENQGEEEEDNEDDEEKEEPQDDYKERIQRESAITWTEDDQKNLIDLGSSELERNQRLENLIARRRARKSMRLMAEKNLIDLDTIDPPFSMPPINTTARGNPFENDIYDDMPIPGSAPSATLPRRNPFDIPYDSTEEKLNLTGDSFHQEFKTVQPKDPVFRRFESFSVGPSVLGSSSKQYNKWKPYFLPERLVSEGTSYHPSFHRQLSELSDSKASSVPETESICSVADEEDNNKLSEGEILQETSHALKVDETSDHVESESESERGSERESESSGDVNYVDMEQVENQDVDEIEHHAFHGIDEEESTKSSISSSSVDDEIVAEIEDNHTEEVDTTIHASLEEESNFNIPNTEEVDIQIKEPVYDSSPSAAEKLISLSFSSSFSDLQEEMPEPGLPHMSVHSESNLVDNISEHAVPSIEHTKHENESRLSGGPLNSDCDTSSAFEDNSDGPEESKVHDYMVEPITSDSSPTFMDVGSVERSIIPTDEHIQHEQDIPMDVVPELSLSSNETVDEISEDNENDIRVEHVGSSSHDANIDMIIKSAEPSEVESLAASENGQTLYVKSVLSQPSFNEEPLEQYVTEAVCIPDNVNVPEVHGPEDDVSPHPTRDPTHTPIEHFEEELYETSENEDQNDVIKGLNESKKAFETRVSDVNINDADDMEEGFEEGLLSELDAVGDFSVVQDSGSSSIKHDVIDVDEVMVPRCVDEDMPHKVEFKDAEINMEIVEPMNLEVSGHDIYKQPALSNDSVAVEMEKGGPSEKAKSEKSSSSSSSSSSSDSDC